MLRVVQTAAWDWAPPHISGYPHPPPPPPQYPPPHAHGQPQQSYHQDPQWPTYPPLPRGPPPPPPHGAPPRGPPPSLPYGTPPGATGQPPKLRPKALLGPFTDVAQIKKVRGRLRNEPDRTSSVAAFNAWFVRSRESHVCGPLVSSAQCCAARWPPLCFHRIRRRPARRRTISPRASKQKDLAPVPWRSSKSVCWVFSTLASLSPPEVAALRVARVARSARSTCRASAVPLEERRHVVRLLQQLPPAKERPKEAAEGAAEGATARAEVSAGPNPWETLLPGLSGDTCQRCKPPSSRGGGGDSNYRVHFSGSRIARTPLRHRPSCAVPSKGLYGAGDKHGPRHHLLVTTYHAAELCDNTVALVADVAQCLAPHAMILPREGWEGRQHTPLSLRSTLRWAAHR